jgi:hypothetical protein
MRTLQILLAGSAFVSLVMLGVFGYDAAALSSVGVTCALAIVSFLPMMRKKRDMMPQL